MKAIVTADIIKSRRLSGKDRLQLNKLIKSSFRECCDLISEAKADKLSFNIIQGDEFQFLINSPEYAYQFVVFFRLALSLSELKPSFRAGIGIGDILDLGKKIYEMDGPAFHYSRDALYAFGKSKQKESLTMIRTGDQDLDDRLYIITLFSDYIESNWSDKQREAIYLYKKTGSLEKTAACIDLSFQAIHQRIQTSGWKQIDIGFDKYRTLIDSRLKP